MKRRTFVLMAMTLFCLVAAAQQRSILGKTDLLALLDAAPSVPETPAAAAARAYGAGYPATQTSGGMDAVYNPFFQRAQTAHQQLKQAVDARKKSTDSPEEMFRKQVESNPVLASMGGADKMKQMTPEQIKQAGMQATMAQAPGAGMQAMMQKVMNDPEYRARYKKMNDAEKQAELQKFTGGAPVVQTPEQQQQSRKALEMNAQNQSMIGNLTLVRNDLTQMTHRLDEVETELAKKEEAIKSSPGNHDDIAKGINTRIAALPLVDMGELGEKVPEPKQEAILKREQVTRDHDRAASELQQRSALYNQRKAAYRGLAADYQNWLTKNGSQLGVSETLVADYEDELIAAAENLGKYSQAATEDATTYEKRYQDSVSARHTTTAKTGRATKSKR